MPSARKIRWAAFRVSFVILAGLVILAVIMVLLTGGTLFERYLPLRTLVPDAAAIGKGTPVRLNGIPVGRVESVQFSGLRDPNRVIEVRFSVDQRYFSQITTDSMGAITPENVQGEVYLDITRGRSGVPIAPNGVLPFQPAPDVMKALDLAAFEARLRKIGILFEDIQQGKGRVGQLVMQDGLYRQTVLRIMELEKAVHEAIAPQRGLGQMIYGDVLFRRIEAPVKQLDEALARLERGEGAGRHLRDSALYDQVRNQVVEMRKTLAELNAGQGAVGRLLKSDEMYVAWNRTLVGLITTVDGFNYGEGSLAQLFSKAQPYESLNGMMREMQSTMQDFRGDPTKFLRINVF